MTDKKLIRINKKELPESWEVAKIEDVSTVILGQSPASSSYNTDGEGLPFFQGKAEFGSFYPQAVKWCTEPKKTALKDDVLISVRAPVGPTNLSPAECCIGRGLAAIRPIDGISYKYLLYYLRSIESEVASLGTGTTFKAISGTVLKNLLVSLAPENEQKHIVAEIEKQFSRLDEAVDNLKRVKANLKRYKASVLKAAVEGKLTEEWRKKHPDVEPADKLLQRILAERRKKWEEVELAKMKAKGKKPKDDKWKKKYKEPAKPELDGLPSLPDGWVWATVIQLSFVVSGQTPKGIANEPISGDIPWFKVGDMNTNGNERLMNKAVMYLTEKRAKKLGLNIQPAGTIIFPKRGGAIATNKKRILSNPSGYDLNTMGVYPIVVHHTYFWQWFLSINLGSLGDGSNVPQINHGDIEPLHVPLPPFVEQIQISEVVERSMSLADGLLSIVDVNLKRADRLRQSILKKAFWGELVSQDMNDEPALTLMKKTG